MEWIQTDLSGGFLCVIRADLERELSFVSREGKKIGQSYRDGATHLHLCTVKADHVAQLLKCAQVEYER